MREIKLTTISCCNQLIWAVKPARLPKITPSIHLNDRPIFAAILCIRHCSDAGYMFPVSLFDYGPISPPLYRQGNLIGPSQFSPSDEDRVESKQADLSSGRAASVSMRLLSVHSAGLGFVLFGMEINNHLFPILMISKMKQLVLIIEHNGRHPSWSLLNEQFLSPDQFGSNHVQNLKRQAN